jgi:uncharacterized paraquat-inducible protein A
MKTSDLGFAFDLVCALAYIITVPLLLMFIFGPAITKGIQKMQDQRYGITSSRIKTPRWQQYLQQKFQHKNKCPQCEFINDPEEECCIKCGTQLKINKTK